MSKAVITGMGIHKFGRFGSKSYVEMGLEAVDMAIKDAGISFKDIQIAFCANVFLPTSIGVRIMAQFGKTGIPVTDVEAACAASVDCVKLAQMAIESGRY